MVITQPTVDDFSDTTVMRVIRKIVNYICSDSGLVAQINDNDITGFTSSYTNNLLKIDATKGDGTKIPVCSLTIEGGSSTGNPYPTGIKGTVGADGNITFTVTMSSGSPLTTTINMNYFASADDLSDLQEQVSGIKPVVTVNDTVSPPTITVAVNGSKSTANLPAGGGDGWETLDLTNLPKDFADGDILEIDFKISCTGSSVNSWDVAPTNVSVTSSTNNSQIVTVKLNNTGAYPRMPILIRDYNKSIIIISINSVFAYSSFNATVTNSNLFSLSAFTFNGGGFVIDETFRITKENISTYVRSMRRKKVNQ